jgi:hypothetical protein
MVVPHSPCLLGPIIVLEDSKYIVLDRANHICAEPLWDFHVHGLLDLRLWICLHIVNLSGVPPAGDDKDEQ